VTIGRGSRGHDAARPAPPSSRSKTDDGRLEVEFEVDQNRSGDKWNVRLRNDGNTFFRGKRTTGGASGSFSVERKTSNGPGEDRISGRARNLRTDEVCRTSINF
jgi:catechol 2,3-dioxygenase-like lactoylglutathione lyase family enzyme